MGTVMGIQITGLAVFYQMIQSLMTNKKRKKKTTSNKIKKITVRKKVIPRMSEWVRIVISIEMD